jgi:hypothetical protein
MCESVPNDASGQPVELAVDQAAVDYADLARGAFIARSSLAAISSAVR